MSMRTGMALCALMALTAPVDVVAQSVGGRLRQRAEQATSQEQKAGEEQQQRVNFDSVVVEISAASLKGLENGLDVEIRLLEEFAALLAPYKKTPEEYRACMDQMGQSPEFVAEYTRIMMQLGNVRDGATMEETQRASEKMAKEIAALALKACGPDPDDWPEYKRREKIEEIQRQAAAAAGPVRSPDPVHHSGPSAIEDESFSGRTAEAGSIQSQQAQGLPYKAYLVMKERVEAFCAFLSLGNTPTPGYQLHFPAVLIDPAITNPDIFWVFTADEVKQIQPLCPRLVLKVGKAQIIMEMEPIKIKGWRR